MNDLVAFLTARLDEREAQARDLIESEAASANWNEPTSGVLFTGPPAFDDTWAGTYALGDSRITRFIAAHDPARVLREVEAARRIIAEYKDSTAITGEDDQYAAGLWIGLRAFAAADSNHPAYRQEWTP